MAAPVTAVQYGPVTSTIYLNSLDRYPNGVPPAASSNQTTATDITFSIPGLSNLATVQVYSTLTTSTWFNQSGYSAISPAFYTNLINLVDYTAGTTYLITIPPTAQNISTLFGNLGKYVMASGYGGSASGNSVPLIINANTGAPTFDPISALTGQWWTWYDVAHTSPHSLGWSRVTTAPDGTNIANRRQLFDLLGLANHVPSVAGLAGVQGSGYTTAVFQTSLFTLTGPIRYMDMISPQLTNFAPDVNTNSNASSNVIARFGATTFNINLFPTAGISGKVMKVAPGSTSLRIQLVDDQQNPIPANYPVPVPYQGALTAGVGILSSTLSNLTFSGISNANTNFPAGTQVNILQTSGSASGWVPGVYQVQSATSNTVVVPYVTTSANQISNATYGFTIAPVWLTSKAGNQNGPEYQITLVGIARTTQ